MKFDPIELGKFQKQLFPYAYNILGSVEESKDVVQDVISKHIQSDKELDNERNYLITSVVNRSINVKNRQKKIVSARIALPEPVATEASDIEIHLNDIASYSLLILLEQLNVKERAVFILKEGFNYSHDEIATVISGTSENSRKLLSRAKSKLKDSRKTGPKMARKETIEYLGTYVSAVREGNIDQLEKLFAKDIKVVADGGDTVRVVSNLTEGKTQCIEILLEVFERFQSNKEVHFAEVNHQPALLFYYRKTLTSCQVFSLDENQRIYRVSAIVDPQKLKNIAQNLV